MPVAFTVNGKPVEVAVEPRTSLASYLRYDLRLTGTHIGCEHGVCGACTVIVDGAAVRSRLMLAFQAEGSSIATVEGLSQVDGLTPLQTAFRKHHGLQCAFCTPGMLTTAHALLSEEPDAGEARIRAILSGNLCPCTQAISQFSMPYSKRGPLTARATSHDPRQLLYWRPDRAGRGFAFFARPR